MAVLTRPVTMGTLEELIGMSKGDVAERANVTFVVEDSTELRNSVVHLSPIALLTISPVTMGTLEELIGMTTGDDTVEANVTFVVEDSAEMNNSVVYLSPVTMDDLNIWYGVAILLEGNNNRKAVCTVLTDENCGENKIRMNEVVRNKFGVSVGDSVALGSFLEIPRGRKIVVRPIRDGSDFVQENLFESYLRPYFFGANRPVNNGDVFSVNGRARTIQFKVIKVFPSPFCIVGPSTVIYCEEQKVASKRRKTESVGVSKKVKSPEMGLQSSATSPVQNIDPLLTRNSDSVPITAVDKLPVPTLNKLSARNRIEMPACLVNPLPVPAVNKLPAATVNLLPAPTVNKLPAPTVDPLPVPTANKLPAPAVDKLGVPTVHKLPLPAINTLPGPTVAKLPPRNTNILTVTTTDKLPVQRCDTPSSHKEENKDTVVAKASGACETITIEAQIQFAHSLHRHGQLNRAKEAFLEIKEAQASKLGRKHPEMLPIRLALATIMYDSGQFDQLTNVFLKDQQLQNCWDPAFLNIKLVIAMVLTEQKKIGDAMEILYEALELRKSMKLSFVKELRVKVILATALYSVNKMEDALKLLSHKTLEDPRFPDTVSKFTYVLKKLTNDKDLTLHYLDHTKLDVLIIKCHIGWFYGQLKDNIKATQILQEILPVLEKRVGSDHFYSQFAATHLQDCKKQLVQERERQRY